MMNTWLMRRPVRRPVSRATTAPSSSSVCRLPFISSSASPCADQLDGFRRRGVAVRRVDDRGAARDRCRCCLRDLADLRGGPDEDRRDQSASRRPRSRRPAPFPRRDAPRRSARARGCGIVRAVLVLSGSGCRAPSSSRPSTGRAANRGAADGFARRDPGDVASTEHQDTARPPSDVSLYLAFISLAVSAMALTVVSKSTRRFAGISLLAIMNPVQAFTAPNAQRSMQGTWTKPATGSQVIPR